MQLNDLHPACKRVAQTGQEQQIRRAGEHEAPGPTVAIDRELDRAQELRHPLDLVEDHAGRQRGHEPGRVAAGERKRRLVVEGDVGEAGLERAGKGRLAGLPRPEKADDGRVAECRLQRCEEGAIECSAHRASSVCRLG